jgi:hypothetical protein
MNQYSVRKYFYVDTIVEANGPEEANDMVNDMDFSIHEAQYLGDLEFNEPDIAEI